MSGSIYIITILNGNQHHDDATDLNKWLWWYGGG